jgi:hypothetical protein
MKKTIAKCHFSKASRLTYSYAPISL